MGGRKPSNSSKVLLCCAVVLLVSSLVGLRNAREPQSDKSPKTTSITLNTEQLEADLARAGCPGWIVLASEGEAALTASGQSPITRTSHTESQPSHRVPRVKYSVPLRIASLPQSNKAFRVAQLSPGSADDPDDLLDGMPDLLAVPDKEESETEAEAEPTESVENAEQPSPDPVEEAPAKSKPESVATEPVTAEPPNVEIEPKPINEPLFPVPGGGLPVEVPFAPQQPQPAPAIPQPEAITPPAPKPEPEPVPAIEQTPFTPPPAPAAPHSLPSSSNGSHCEFVADSLYPTAEACSKCHEKIYDEWRGSSHAYAMVSPMFHKFEQTINDLSQGTVGYFCYRCHSPAGVALGISRAAPLWELPEVALEGVTCVACHRVNQRYGKVNGERRIEPGGIHDPVYGPIGGSGVAEVISQKSHYKVKTSPHEQGPGQDIHTAGFCFEQLSKPEFCVSCHQVAVHPGIKLEVVWEQYRASPACKKGISCQDCHMGRIPGVPSGYEVGAAAEIDNKVVHAQRKHANHVFYGPGYSIAHPGIFPLNPKAKRWSIRDWLQFDHRAGWGTEEFESSVAAGQIRPWFPPAWAEIDDRYDAREIIEANLNKLSEKTVLRQQLMENGSHVDGPYFDTPLVRGQDLKFHYVMTNTNEGHNLPSGSLGAQPQLWANVVLIGPRGNRLWESGYTDRWGDVADIHSEDVRHKRIPYDWQLFNLQTMFLISGAKGTDREFFLPINFDIDQLPYLRPGAQPISVINHPPFIRMEGRSLAPLGSRRIPYRIPAELMCKPGNYRLSFRLRSRAEPIYFMRFVGSTTEMQRTMNEWMVNFHQSSVEFTVR